MTEELFRCGYGAILECDKEVLEACLRELAREVSPQIVRVLEIGMHDGGTAKGIESFFAKIGCSIDYVGIDPDDGSTRPRYVPAGGKVIVGDSAEVFHQVKGEFDLVWVDGCHCENHVVLDTIHYAPKVRVGGFVCYHDVNPRGQMRSDTGHQYCGADGVPEFGIAVERGLQSIGLRPEIDLTRHDGETGHSYWINRAEFLPFMRRIPSDPQRIDCGTLAYQRIA